MKATISNNRNLGDEEDPRTDVDGRPLAEEEKGSENRKENKVWLILLCILATLGALGIVIGVVLSSSKHGDSTAIDTTTAPSSLPINAATPAPTLAQTPVRRQVSWVLSAVNGEDELTPDSIFKHFSETFRSQVSDEDLVTIFQNISSLSWGGQVTILHSFYETDFLVVVLVGADRSPDKMQLQMTLSVQERPPHLVDGIQFQEPPKGLEVTPQSFTELANQLRDLAAGSTYLAAEIIDGECNAISGSYNQDFSVPLGSTFKLYVLGALAQSIIDGDLAWMDELRIQENLKTLPTGTMQYEAAGTQFTLLEYAQKMIQISDNTATDHLIDLLGRDWVEAVQTDLGHHNASLNVPFLSMGDFFRLKCGLNDSQTLEYLGLDVEGKRQFLNDLSDQMHLDSLDLSVLASPRLINSVGWFATPNDICRAYVGLGDLALDAGEDEMRSILEFHQGALDEDSSWEFVGFKGGSEAGVAMLSFVAERSDGRRFVQVLSLADPDQLVDAEIPHLLAMEGFRLLGEIS